MKKGLFVKFPEAFRSTAHWWRQGHRPELLYPPGAGEPADTGKASGRFLALSPNGGCPDGGKGADGKDGAVPGAGATGFINDIPPADAGENSQKALAQTKKIEHQLMIDFSSSLS